MFTFNFQKECMLADISEFICPLSRGWHHRQRLWFLTANELQYDVSFVC